MDTGCNGKSEPTPAIGAFILYFIGREEYIK